MYLGTEPQQKPRLQRSHAAGPLMATLEEFKALRDGVPAEVQAELYKPDSPQTLKRPSSGWWRLRQRRAMTLTVEEVTGFLKQMDEDDEFDDFELDIVALAAIAGGFKGDESNCCQEEAHDEPWGVALACDPCASGSLVAHPRAFEQTMPLPTVAVAGIAVTTVLLSVTRDSPEGLPLFTS